MTAAAVQLDLFAPESRVWDRYTHVPQHEQRLTVRDAHGLTARQVAPGRWEWTRHPHRDDTHLDREEWKTGDPWYWPAYLTFPVTEHSDTGVPVVTAHLPAAPAA